MGVTKSYSHLTFINRKHLVVSIICCTFAAEIKQKSNNLKSFWNMEKNYKIVGRTNGWIASRDIHFNGKTEITIESNLTLREAQKKLLDFSMRIMIPIIRIGVWCVATIMTSLQAIRTEPVYMNMIAVIILLRKITRKDSIDKHLLTQNIWWFQKKYVSLQQN